MDTTMYDVLHRLMVNRLTRTIPGMKDDELRELLGDVAGRAPAEISETAISMAREAAETARSARVADRPQVLDVPPAGRRADGGPLPAGDREAPAAGLDRAHAAEGQVTHAYAD